MIETIKNIFTIIIFAAIALFFYVKSVNEKQEKQREAEYAAERSWKDPLIQNCENSVRGIADAQSISFFKNIFESYRIEKTDSGYLYRVEASDATMANKTVTMLCYTNRNGKVVRLVPQDR